MILREHNGTQITHLLSTTVLLLMQWNLNGLLLKAKNILVNFKAEQNSENVQPF